MTTRIGDINREIKLLMKQLVDGDDTVLSKITELSREKEQLFKPRKFSRD